MLQAMSCASRAPGRLTAGRLASAIVQRTQRRHAASSAWSAPSTSNSSSSNSGESPPPPPPAAASSRARAFLEIERKSTAYRPASDRVQDWREIFPAGDSTQPEATAAVRAEQASRCMDCGTPFCQTHTGCPIHNLIPEFNSLAADGEWKRAWESLRSTNNFPEFTTETSSSAS